MFVNYNSDEYQNRWNGETIDMRNIDSLTTITSHLPFDQIIIEEETNPNTDAIVFDIYDEQTNQVFFFDCFVRTDPTNSQIVSSHPFGKLTIYGRPYKWLNLDDVWAPHDLIVHDLYF